MNSFECKAENLMSHIPAEDCEVVLMRHAWDMLKDERKKISTIAKELGFVNHSSFSIAFKKYYHCTPRFVRDYFISADVFKEQLRWLSRREVGRLMG